MVKHKQNAVSIYGLFFNMSMKTETRISKYLARAGLASRRDAEKLLIAGRVSINGITTKNEFNGLFEFEQYVFPIHLNDSWVDNVIQKMYECLQSDKLPPSGGGWNGQGCEQCAYKKSLAKLMRAQIEKENQVNSE